MGIEKTNKSASIAIDVPAFSDLSDPKATADAIRAGLDTARRLLEWERHHRTRWIALEEDR